MTGPVLSAAKIVLWAVRTFYVDDPEGNEVECIAIEPSAEPAR